MPLNHEVESQRTFCKILIRMLQGLSINPTQVLKYSSQNKTVTFKLFKNYLNDIILYFDISDQCDSIILATPQSKAKIVTI